MNNSLLPSVLSSELFSFENEAISDVNPMRTESKINFYGNGLDSRLSSDIDQESCIIPCQSPIYYQTGPPLLVAEQRLEDYPNVVTDSLMNMSTYSFMPQQPSTLSNKVSLPQFDNEFKAMQNGSKRSKSCSDESTRNKVVCFGYDQQYWEHQAKEDARVILKSEKSPARRSQKLSDKITALQKLVSPYGKTDTASVLQEASISIKLLQDQIQNLFDRLNNSYIKNKPVHLQETEEKLNDLRTRGLCLVPISMTHKLTKEDQFVQY